VRTLGILSAVVTALLVGLWFLIRDTDAPAATPRSGSSATTTTEPAPVSQPSSRARSGSGANIVMRRPQPQPTVQTPSSSQGGPAPALASDGGGSQAELPLKDALRDQVSITETQVIACNDKALKAGTRLDGATAVAFKVARNKDGKIVAEPTGVEYSSIADQGVVDCIRDAAKTMVFDSLPEGVDSLTGYRKVVLKNGAVVENWLTEFSVTEPKPPN
jgi:hypothetical protein